MKSVSIAILMVLSCAFAHGEHEAKQDVPSGLFKALQAVRVSCPEAVRDDESRLFCASTPQDVTSFKDVVEAVDTDTLTLRSTGDWGSYEGKDIQRSYLYRDGFMTIALYEGMAPNNQGLVIIRTLMPHD